MDTASSVNDKIMYHRRSSFVNHVGSHFLMGSAAGAAVHPFVGYGSAAAGGRLAGAACAVVKNVPCTGGFIGAYSALIYVFEGAMVGARGGRHDRWNTTAASAAAFGLLHVPRVSGSGAVAYALFGAALGGMFGAGITSFDT